MSVLEEIARAIEDDECSIVESLIATVDVNARLPREDSPTALIWAVCCERKAIVALLLRANARIDDVDESHWTACHYAAEEGNCAMLQLLLAHQPNLEIVDCDGISIFGLALFGSFDFNDAYVDCAWMLFQAGASLDTVTDAGLVAFAALSTAAIQVLLDRGVDLRELHKDRNVTPLHVAAFWRDAAVLAMLVNVCGLDLDARNLGGYTPIHNTLKYGNVSALRFLVGAGADVNCESNDGGTPLHLVDNYDCALILLAGGADACARGGSGRTPLHETEVLSIAHTLLAAGADLDAVDDDGNTCRQVLAREKMFIDPDRVKVAHRDIAKTRIDFVRYRALSVCIGLQALHINALQLCEILQFACGAVARLIPFHIWWKIVTTVKHFRSN